MQRTQRDGLAWYTFERPGPAFKHALITRLGGVSAAPFASLNLGGSVGDNAVHIAENHRRIFSALGITHEQVVSPHQVHGCRVARVGAEHGGTVIAGTDALVTGEPGLALLLRFADCVPVLFYDPVQHVIGLAHAGWRGAAAGVVPATVRALARIYETTPANLWVGIGPAIGVDHYEVGAEVIEAIKVTLPDGTRIGHQVAGRWHLDMAGVIMAQLRALGVTQIDCAGMCTACRTDEWYSHRMENGKTGRFGALVMLDN